MFVFPLPHRTRPIDTVCLLSRTIILELASVFVKFSHSNWDSLNFKLKSKMCICVLKYDDREKEKNHRVNRRDVAFKTFNGPFNWPNDQHGTTPNEVCNEMLNVSSQCAWINDAFWRLSYIFFFDRTKKNWFKAKNLADESPFSGRLFAYALMIPGERASKSPF